MDDIMLRLDYNFMIKFRCKSPSSLRKIDEQMNSKSKYSKLAFIRRKK